ncbi:hypothetical protein CDV31_013087 [Fusarium ambrosium]|uniref:Uncharacterized protein n=1 Tax=Fusarium ambrosium TaxID=131363 RepID=A0A428T5M0_9HYPO|nr:hypothetical protein CDV31_013087 [Fusarium ambrosium]
MCPRKEISEGDPKEFARVQHYRMALSWIPIQKGKFKDVLTRMHVPSIFMDMVKRPRTVFKKLKSSIQGQPCEVYILSVDSILTQYTAMSVTYFPKTQQVFGLFLGYGSPDDVTNMASKLFNNRAFVNNPFVLISAFLELERKHRIRQVDNMVDGLRTKISKGQHIQKSNKETSDDQPETFYELYNQVGVLRSQLNMWKLQLDKLLIACPTLPPFNTLSTEGFMLEPTDYVTEIREIFEESAMRCENVMQATSLAFQKELAEVARQDSKVAIGDAQQMKAIALLTMFFLPATAVAGFMDAPVYDWENKGHYFWYIAGPLTGAVMLMYLVWTTVLKTR